MSTPRILSTPQITVNNITLNIVPNSLTYTEGLGTQEMRAQSAGGGTIVPVTSINLESRFSTIKFNLYSTTENLALARSFKSQGFDNAISFADGEFTRYANNAGITNDYEAKLSENGTIDLEWKSLPVV
jgi:hypothetical protein